MKYDIIICGVGGQGSLSVSVVITKAALAQGLFVKQSEVHGMSQRGGEVLAHLRISDSDISSPLIPEGCADLILSFEPLEALRYLKWLSPKGSIVSASEPIKNFPSYPDLNSIHEEIKKHKNARLIDADALAKKAATARSSNMVLVGAVSALLPIKKELLCEAIKELFERKGDAVVSANIKAFDAGALNA